MSRQKTLVLLHYTHTSWPLPSVANSLSFQPSYLSLSASLSPTNPLSLLCLCRRILLKRCPTHVQNKHSTPAIPPCPCFPLWSLCQEINECVELSWSELQVSLRGGPSPCRVSADGLNVSRPFRGLSCHTGRQMLACIYSFLCRENAHPMGKKMWRG